MLRAGRVDQAHHIALLDQKGGDGLTVAPSRFQADMNRRLGAFAQPAQQLPPAGRIIGEVGTLPARLPIPQRHRQAGFGDINPKGDSHEVLLEQ